MQSKKNNAKKLLCFAAINAALECRFGVVRYFFIIIVFTLSLNRFTADLPISQACAENKQMLDEDSLANCRESGRLGGVGFGC